MKKWLLALLTVWIVITITFFVSRAVPGGPFMGEKAISEAAQAALEAKYGLDKPVFEQYTTYLTDILTKFDFGPSLKQRGQNVIDIIARGLKVSAKLGLSAAVIAAVFGIVMGSTAALKRNSFLDRAIMVFSTACVSMPSFIMGSLVLLVIIFFGTVLLMVPRSTLDGVSISLVDALFTATSSVCITGLSTVNVATTFSTDGLIIIALLIQIGGLGVMTITSFFALFFMGHTTLYDQFALRDMVGSDAFSSLMSTLLYILGFTLGIEAIGAFFIWTTIHGDLGMGLRDEILFSVFHAISSFCNAGFSTLNGNLGNPMLIQGHGSFYIIISMLILLGSIGFPILVNFKNVIFYHIRYLFAKIVRHKVPAKYPHLTRLNTKIAISWTIALLVIGAVSIALIEWNGAFAGMSVKDKIVQSIFNAVVPRTAGFNSIEVGRFSLLTLVIYIILMWIGGASQSTAGGIKVNTIGVAFASFMSVVRGESNVRMFNREISDSSVRRAYATIFGSVMMIIICFITLLILEPNLDPFDLFFETVSALGTVGASIGITPELSTTSKVLVSAMMFVGRVGIITVAMSLFSRKEQPHYRLPEENVIIN